MEKWTKAEGTKDSSLFLHSRSQTLFKLGPSSPCQSLWIFLSRGLGCLILEFGMVEPLCTSQGIIHFPFLNPKNLQIWTLKKE